MEMPDTRTPASVRPARRRRRGARSSRVTGIAILLPPALILFSLFVILLLTESGYSAFFDWNGYGTPENHVGLCNFEQLCGHGVFHTAIGKTVKIVAVLLFIQMPLALFLALLIYRKTPTNALFRLIYLLPYILAEVAAGLIRSFIFDGNYRVTASIARSMGQDSFFILADRDWAFVAVMAVMV